MKKENKKQVFITRTIKANFVQVKGFNIGAEQVEERSKIIDGKITDKNMILAQFHSEGFMAYEILKMHDASEKRKITLEDFMKYSVPCDGTEEEEE